MRGEEPVALKVRHVLSREEHMYYEKCTEAILDTTQSVKQQVQRHSHPHVDTFMMFMTFFPFLFTVFLIANFLNLLCLGCVRQLNAGLWFAPTSSIPLSVCGR